MFMPVALDAVCAYAWANLIMPVGTHLQPIPIDPGEGDRREGVKCKVGRKVVPGQPTHLCLTFWIVYRMMNGDDRDMI